MRLALCNATKAGKDNPLPAHTPEHVRTTLQEVLKGTSPVTAGFLVGDNRSR